VITRDEITEKSEAMGIHWSNVQRDYVFGWLLSGMYQVSPLANSLVLKGGNVLRKAYIPSTRFSDDLDFSTTGTLPGETLLAGLNQVCSWAQAKSGVRFDVDRNRIVEGRRINDEKQVYKLKLLP
jgi:predicted nucleotidyltransferase component of viral defense system